MCFVLFDNPRQSCVCSVLHSCRFRVSIEVTMVREMKMAPLRRLDDFLLNSARYQLPNFSDIDKWGNRVTNNFLYYQTNYFLLAIMIFLLVA